MTDLNNWLQEVERATRDWDDESKDALICGENMCHLLRQAVTMVRDAERLDWLVRHISGKEYRRIGIIYEDHSLIRESIDAALRDASQSEVKPWRRITTK